jgi:hypothetical protein
MVKGNGLRRESSVRWTYSLGFRETVTVTDQDGQVAKITERWFQEFPWGTELVNDRLVSTGSSADRISGSFYTFYSGVAASDPNYGRLKQRNDTNGYWELYT